MNDSLSVPRYDLENIFKNVEPGTDGHTIMMALLGKHDEQSKRVMWKPRGIGYGGGAPDFLTGELSDGDHDISGFVFSKAEGELAVEILGGNARLDYRPFEPGWIQVKINCTDEAVLEELSALVKDNDYFLTPAIVAAAKLKATVEA